ERELRVEVEPAALPQRRPRPAVGRARRQGIIRVAHRAAGVVHAEVGRHLRQAPGVRAGAVAVLVQLRHAEAVVNARLDPGRRLAGRLHGCVGGGDEERSDGDGNGCDEEEALRWTHPDGCFGAERDKASVFIETAHHACGERRKECMQFITLIDSGASLLQIDGQEFRNGRKACILSSVYPTLDQGKGAHLYIFNSGVTEIKVSRLAAREMKKPLMCNLQKLIGATCSSSIFILFAVV
ncbi:hypothetical protein EJB05_21428, partial [Eragrostis curvula]